MLAHGPEGALLDELLREQIHLVDELELVSLTDLWRLAIFARQLLRTNFVASGWIESVHVTQGKHRPLVECPLAASLQVRLGFRHRF